MDNTISAAVYQACEIQQRKDSFSIPTPTNNMKEFEHFRAACDWAKENFSFWQVWEIRKGYEPKLVMQKLIRY